MVHTAYKQRPGRGFTLIELMIALAVAAVLLAIAVPSYQDSVRKGRRADAVAGITKLQLLQERFRAENPSYAAAVASLPGSPSASSPDGHYSLAIGGASANGYNITATANGGSPQFGDTRCRRLRVTMNAGTITPSSFDAAGTEDTTNTNRCWAR